MAASEASESQPSSEAVPRRKKQIAKRPPQTERSGPNSQSKSPRGAKLKKTGKLAPPRRRRRESSDEAPSESESGSEESDRPKKRQPKTAAPAGGLDDSDLELIEKNIHKPRKASREARAASGRGGQPGRKAADSDGSEGSVGAASQPRRGRRKLVDSQEEDESY